MENNRLKALENAISILEKQYGQGTIMRLGNKPGLNENVLSTGIWGIDYDLLGIGGFPKGRIVEIYGPESSGKTSLALHVAAACQKQGGTVAYIDAEHALDPVYADKIGVDIENLLVSQPDHGEQALEIADILVRSGTVDVLVIDSVAALVPRAEIEGNMGDNHVGLQARLMSQAMRKLTSSVSKNNCLVIFINQIREKVGAFYGNNEITPGGKALKFYASIRLEVKKIDTVKQDNEVIGSRVKIKAVKNKTAPPFRQTELEIYYAEGFDYLGNLLEKAEQVGIIKKSGAWYHFLDEKIQGKREMKKVIDRHQKEIMDLLKERMG